MTKELMNKKPSFFSFERYGFLKDIALIYLLLIGVEYFFFDFGTTYNSLPLHPFWIAVILISSHYGTASGLLSALVGIALLQFNTESTAHLNSVDSDYFQLTMQTWGQPVLWFITAIFLGELRHNTIRKFTQSRNKIDLLTLQNKTLTAYCDELQALTADLEHKIATQDQKTSPYVLDKLSAVQTMPVDQVPSLLPPLMEELFGAVKFSLYDRQNGHFKQAVAFGHSHSQRVTNQSGQTLPAHIKYIAEKPDFLSALSKEDSPILGQNALFSGPVLNYNPLKNKNQLRGILSIEMLESDRITPQTALLFQLVCARLAFVLESKEQNKVAIDQAFDNLQTQDQL